MSSFTRTSLRIVLDQDIPGAAEVFSALGTIIAVPGHEIDAHVVKNADVLIVRSITKVDETLLEGSSVGFVGTATAGTDHLDIGFLSASGIEWASAPGANAESVVEYVMASIAVIARRRATGWQGKTLGIIGCGHVGGRLATRAEAAGMRVLRNDPPRADKEDGGAFMDLYRMLPLCDIVSLHVPLDRSGSHPTVHLMDLKAFGLVRSGAWVIQSSRGGTMDEHRAVQARRSGYLGALVLDVFEGEPQPDPVSVDTADLATGHIAGYSRDAKRNGVLMIRDAVMRYLKSGQTRCPAEDSLIGVLTRPLDQDGRPVGIDHPSWLDRVLRQVINIPSDDARFRAVVASPDPVRGFHAYRAGYPARYSWSRYAAWSGATAEEMTLLEALGFRPSA